MGAVKRSVIDLLCIVKTNQNGIMLDNALKRPHRDAKPSLECNKLNGDLKIPFQKVVHLMIHCCFWLVPFFPWMDAALMQEFDHPRDTLIITVSFKTRGASQQPSSSFIPH